MKGVSEMLKIHPIFEKHARLITGLNPKCIMKFDIL